MKSKTIQIEIPVGCKAEWQEVDGKFVLVVESKKTPLNVRYTAKRVDIEVIASDDTQSAVSGLYGSEFVVTNSTVPISDKQQVRLAEN